MTVIPMRLIAQHAESNPTGRAIVTDTRELTWTQFLEQSKALRSWLTERLDHTRDQRVVTFARNSAELVVAASAVGTLGIPLVGIDPARDAATVAAQLAAVDPTIVILDMALPGAHILVTEAATRALVIDIGEPGGQASFPRLADVTASDWEGRSWAPHSFVALGFTSGSTGVPKLFVRRTQSENQRESFLRDRLAFGPADVFLISSPLAHASGHAWAHAALARGATIVLTDQGPEQLVDVVRQYRVSGTFMAQPTLDAFLVASTARPDIDLSSLRLLLTGGRHISDRTVRVCAHRLGRILHVYYATTETGIATMACPADLDAAPLTAGAPMPGVLLRIVDPCTRADAAPGHAGLIAVHSPVNMDGYAAGGLTLLRRDGRDYVLTSDYGRHDSAGHLFVCGRADTASGRPLDLVRLESELKDVPGLADVCVTRRVRGDALEVVVAMTGDADPATVRASTKAHLGSEQDGCVVLTVPAIPYNSAGKVDLQRFTALVGASAAREG